MRSWEGGAHMRLEDADHDEETATVVLAHQCRLAPDSVCEQGEQAGCWAVVQPPAVIGLEDQTWDWHDGRNEMIGVQRVPGKNEAVKQCSPDDEQLPWFSGFGYLGIWASGDLALWLRRSKQSCEVRRSAAQTVGPNLGSHQVLWVCSCYTSPGSCNSIVSSEQGQPDPTALLPACPDS